jgi:hypothetical protein
MVHFLLKKKRVGLESTAAGLILPESNITGPASHFNPKRKLSMTPPLFAVIQRSQYLGLRNAIAEDADGYESRIGTIRQKSCVSSVLASATNL